MNRKHPYIEAEIRYAVREYAMTAVDFLARRIRIAFLDYRTAHDMLPTVIKLMGEELKWDKGEM